MNENRNRARKYEATKGQGGKRDRKLNALNKTRMTKSNSNKNERRNKEVIDSVLRESESNPYSWYAKNPQFTKDAGTLPFAKPLGALISGGSTDKFVNPGIMRITFTPTVGYSKNMSSAINRAAVEFKTYLRSVMRASADYDAADTMIYFMAMDSAYMFHAMMRRAYDTAQLFSPLNLYFPRALLQYQGFDPSIANDLARFRSYINKFALNLQRFAVPNGFDITDRHQWMCSGVYLDSNSTRAQSYLFCPSLLWQYDNTNENGSSLQPVMWQNSGTAITLHTFDQVVTIGEGLLQALNNDNDITDISGDIFRAYTGNLRALTEVREGEMLIPSYDPVVLSQIENAVICGDVDPASSITQNPSVNNGSIISNIKFNLYTRIIIGTSDMNVVPQFQHSTAFLNSHVDSPSPEAIIEMTRLTVACSTDRTTIPTAQAGMFEPDIYPADVVNRIWIGLFNADGTGALSTLSNPTSSVLYSDSTPNATLLPRMQFMALIQSFDWAPMLYLYDVTNATTIGSYCNLVHVIGDVDNFTPIPSYQLQDMHDAAMFSLFDVPKLANLSK